MKRVLLALALAGCTAGSSTIDGTSVTVGAATLDVPTGWSPSVTDDTMARQVWAPADNARKESLAIRVVDRDPEKTVDELLALAVQAQGQLAGGRLSRQERVTSKAGAPGIWLDVVYTPPAGGDPYTRSHVVLVGDAHVFHILYTARQPDSERPAVRLALDTIQEGA